MPKIKFIGKDTAPPAFLMNGREKIELPADQTKPFSHPLAKMILKTFPELYKPDVAKGTKVKNLARKRINRNAKKPAKKTA